jgi:hypothetical protein
MSIPVLNPVASGAFPRLVAVGNFFRGHAVFGFHPMAPDKLGLTLPVWRGSLADIAYPMITAASKVLAAVITGLVISGVSCSPTHGVGQSPVATARRVLSADEAAQLAAKLANDQCDRQYQKRPFDAAQHSAVRQNGRYRWGGLDVGGPGGFSALVTFRPDGSEPQVEVYFSTDVLRPQKLTPDLPPGGRQNR